MEVRPDILNKLICSVCDGYLSSVPIRMKNDGSVLCGRCCDPEDEPTLRITPYEHLAEMMLFPCQNKLHGCPEAFYMTELKDHEDGCIYHQQVCPVSESGKCDWSGSRKDILDHCTEQHADNVLQEPYTIQHEILNTNHKTFLMVAFQMLFIIHCKVCITSKNIYHSICLIGKSAFANQYTYEVEMSSNGNKLTSGREVGPQSCMSLQEDMSVLVDINTMIKFLGDFKDIIFKIQIGRKCIQCNTFAWKYLQPTDAGWCCQDCTASRKLCRYSSKGCTYMDITKKTEKHEIFHCQYGAVCKICLVYCDSRNLHYSNKHWSVTYKAGNSREVKVANSWKYFLIKSEVGLLLCRHILNNTQFELIIHSPLLSEQLSNYRCVVKLTNNSTDFTLRKTMALSYDEQWDWQVQIDNEDFRMYVSNGQFNIKIDIIEIETCCDENFNFDELVVS